MALTSGRPESGSKSDALQFQEGMAAVGSEENQSVSADWLAADWLAGSMSINAMLTSVASKLLLTAVSWF